MDFSEKWGKDIEEATALALKDLNVPREEVEVIVLEEPSRGFLGIGSKLAKVRVEIKAAQQKMAEENAEVNRILGIPEEKVEEVVVEETVVTETIIETEEVETFEVEEEVMETGKHRRTLATRPDDLTEVTDHAALRFLEETSVKMGLELEMKAYINEDCVFVDIEGKDSGTIIGKRGQTLDAIQYLTSLVVNKEDGKYKRVVVDAENYRSKREKTLEQLANRLADKVVRTRRRVKLEPMNPYERMVIHATLQNNPKVITKSDGEEPYRRVIIELK